MTFRLPTTIFKHSYNLLREKYLKNQDDGKNASNDFIASRTLEFYETEISKHVSYWWKYVDFKGSYFD